MRRESNANCGRRLICACRQGFVKFGLVTLGLVTLGLETLGLETLGLETLGLCREST